MFTFCALNFLCHINQWGSQCSSIYIYSVRWSIDCFFSKWMGQLKLLESDLSFKKFLWHSDLRQETCLQTLGEFHQLLFTAFNVELITKKLKLTQLLNSVLQWGFVLNQHRDFFSPSQKFSMCILQFVSNNQRQKNDLKKNTRLHSQYRFHGHLRPCCVWAGSWVEAGAWIMPLTPSCELIPTMLQQYGEGSAWGRGRSQALFDWQPGTAIVPEAWDHPLLLAVPPSHKQCSATTAALTSLPPPSNPAPILFIQPTPPGRPHPPARTWTQGAVTRFPFTASSSDTVGLLCNCVQQKWTYLWRKSQRDIVVCCAFHVRGLRQDELMKLCRGQRF